MSHRRPREQEWSAYDSDEDRRPRRSTRHRDPESEYIRPSGYESPPPNYSEAPRARDRGRSDRDDTRRQAPRHHSSDAYRSSAAPRRRYDNYPSDSEDSEEEYRRRSRRQKPREPEADRDRGRHYPPRAGGEAPRRGREGTYYPPRAGEARPAPPSRTRSWSETFAQSGAKDKVMAAGSAALAAGAAEAWRCRKDKGKLMEKGFKVGTAAAGAAAVAAFKNGGKEAEGRRRDDRDRDRDRDRGRRDDRYDDRYEERGGGGGGKTDAIKSAIGGILVSKMAKGFMGGK